MALSTLRNDDIEALRLIVEKECLGPSRDLPCASVSLVGDGRRYAEDLWHFVKSPSLSEENQDARSDHDVYWLASCTKLVTAIACLQLVEKSILALDDSDCVSRLCPELEEVKVLGPNGQLIGKTKRITLRMLLTHTAGFGYSFLNPALKAYRHQLNLVEFDEFSGRIDDLKQPLVNQPGERFEYGISMDWAGILVERASGTKLNDYMIQHIFEPLGIQDLAMRPSPVMMSRSTGIWKRDEKGDLSPRKYPTWRSLDRGDDEDLFHSGGAGLFGSIREFSKILAALLNNGAAQETGQRILSARSVDLMFENQLIDQPDFARRALPAVKPDLVHPAPELYPLCPPSKPQGWGLGFMISPGVTGRSDSTAHWSGLSNIFWWCDREKGVAGVVGSQVLPFVDPKAVALWVRVEESCYAAIGNIETAGSGGIPEPE